VSVLEPVWRAFTDITIPVAPGATYEHRVLACNVIGQCAASAAVPVTTVGMQAPASFTASQRASDGRVVLAWSDLPAESSYLVQWRADSTAGWTTVVSTSTQTTVTEIATDRVAAGQLNQYRVAGVAFSKRTGPWATASVMASQGRHLAAQTGAGALTSSTTAGLNGTVTPNGGATSARFEWGTDPELGSSSSTPSQPVGASSAPVAVSATITVPSPGTYYYRVVASDAVETVRGSIRSVYVGPPAAPALTAAFTTAGFQVNLGWTHTGTGAPAQFRVHRRPQGGTTWTLKETLLASARSYVDIQFPVNAARAYDYFVEACNVAGQCTPSTTQSVTTTPMPAPSGVTATLQGGQVQVLWQDLAGTQGYLVQWRTESTAWQPLITTGNNVTSHTTTRVTPGTTNHYRVAGVASGRTGPFTETSVVVP
jgi:hypothetical protein